MSRPRLGGEGNDRVSSDSERLRQRSERFAQQIVRDSIGLRRHHEIRPIVVAQPFVKLNVRLLRRNRNVHQRHAQRQRLARFEIGIDEARPQRGDRFRHARVSVTRKIDEEKLGMRFAGTPQLEKVDGLSSSRSVAGLRDLVGDERIDQARLADVGTSQEGDLRRARRRKLLRIGGGGHEAGQNLHEFTMVGRAGKSKPSGTHPPPPKMQSRFNKGLSKSLSAK